MLVDYFVLFAVCQAAYVQPDGITLPITSLSYKSLPTSPKEISLSFPNTENVETTSDVKLIEPASSPRMTSKYVYPGNYNLRPTVPISMLPQSQILQTNSPRQIEKSISIQNLGFNTATTPQVTTLPVINLPSKEENNILWDKISTNYSLKTSSLIGATQNVINNSNNMVNLNYCVPTIAPYNTYKINNVNTPAIYIGGNKQKQLRPEVPDFGGELEEIHLISERDSKQNPIKNEMPSKISEGIFVPDLSNNSVQQKNIDVPKKLRVPNVEKQQILSNNVPTVINKGIYPLNNIMLSSSSFPNTHPYINTLNAPSVSGRINITPNLASTDNKVDLKLTPSVKIDNNKINSPQQTTVSEVLNINDIGVIHPNTKPLNDLKAPVPTLTTYFYAPRELPKVYQLPNVYTNTKTIPLYNPLNFSPTSSVCKESNTYNNVKRENIADTTTVPLENLNYNPENIMAKTSAQTDTINYIPSILKYYPTHVSDTPTISQLPNVYTIPKVPDAPQRTETYPSNIIYINMADMSSQKSIDNRVPICNLDTEAKLKRPIQPVAGTTTLPLYTLLDSKNIKSLNYIPAPNVVHYQPEYTNFAITPSLESQYLCPSKSILFPSSDLCGSSISDSLNNLISSVISTGLLSAFYDIATPEENVLSMLSDTEFITNSLSDTPSYKYSETSITLSMPVFLLSPPQLESPSFLPAPKVLLPLKESENKLSSKKKPKPYISTITINLLPTKEETNDIIIML